MGDANASIPTPEPVLMRPMFGACGHAAAKTSLGFVSKTSLEAGIERAYGLTPCPAGRFRFLIFGTY